MARFKENDYNFICHNSTNSLPLQLPNCKVYPSLDFTHSIPAYSIIPNPGWLHRSRIINIACVEWKQDDSPQSMLAASLMSILIAYPSMLHHPGKGHKSKSNNNILPSARPPGNFSFSSSQPTTAKFSSEWPNAVCHEP